MNPATDDVETIFRQVMVLDPSVPVESLHRSQMPQWDSIRHAELVIKLQKHFNVRFTFHQLVEMKSIGDIRKWIKDA